MADDYEDIDLASLSDDELVEQMHNDLYDGMRDETVVGTNILLERGFSATRVLDDALVAGMKIVGVDFRDGILFVPEVLLAENPRSRRMFVPTMISSRIPSYRSLCICSTSSSSDSDARSISS